MSSKNQRTLYMTDEMKKMIPDVARELGQMREFDSPNVSGIFSVLLKEKYEVVKNKKKPLMLTKEQVEDVLPVLAQYYEYDSIEKLISSFIDEKWDNMEYEKKYGKPQENEQREW